MLRLIYETCQVVLGAAGYQVLQLSQYWKKTFWRHGVFFLLWNLITFTFCSKGQSGNKICAVKKYIMKLSTLCLKKASPTFSIVTWRKIIRF